MEEAGSSSVAIMVPLHGTLLRMASDSTAMHYQGLAIAGRDFFRRGRISLGMKKKFLNVDRTAAYIRHITAKLARELADDLAECRGAERHVAFPGQEILRKKMHLSRRDDVGYQT